MEMSRKISWCVTSKCSTVNVSGSLVRVIDFVFTSEINVLCVMMIVEGGGGGSILFSRDTRSHQSGEERGLSSRSVLQCVKRSMIYYILFYFFVDL